MIAVSGKKITYGKLFFSHAIMRIKLRFDVKTLYLKISVAMLIIFKGFPVEIGTSFYLARF